MIEILNRWNGALLYQAVDATDIRMAVIAAVESGANLSGADLSGANLRSANLSGANQYVLRIVGSRDKINVIDDDIRIGCQRESLDWWILNYSAIGVKHGYSTEQIAEYGLHLLHIQAVLALPRKPR